MKCSKYLVKENKLHQQTLAESWFCKNNSKAIAYSEDQSNESSYKNVNKKLKSPIKTFNKLIVPRDSKSSLNETKNSLEDKENESDDNDTVTSSQSNNDSRLKKKNLNSLLKKAITCNSADEKFSLSDFNEFNSSSSVIKDELIEEICENFVSEPIELSHDLNYFIDDPNVIENILLSTSVLEMEQSGDKHETDPLQDPLHMEDEGILTHSGIPLSRKRTRSETRQSISKRVCYNSHTQSSDGEDEEKDYSKRKTNPKNKKHKDELPKDLRLKLKFIKIKLQHLVPPQHKIEPNAGTRPLSEEQSVEFETYGPLKRGPFTESEDDTIKKNWRDFCEIHEWDENLADPFLNMRHKGRYYIQDLTERKNFVRFLANGLPWRSLYSVYFRYRNLFNTSVDSGKYTSKEDKIIISHMHNASASTIVNKCAELAIILNRKRQSVCQRFRKLKVIHDLTNKRNHSDEVDSDNSKHSTPKKKPKLKKKKGHNKLLDRKIKIVKTSAHNEVSTDVKWTSTLVNEFINTLLKLTSSDVKGLKNKKIDEKVWIQIENSISINHATLRNFWYCQLHMQLFSPIPIYLNDIKIKLIEYMHDNKEFNLENFLWENVCLHFDGVTTEFLSKLFDRLVQHSQTKIDSTNLKDVVNYLYEYYIPELEEKTIDAILPKLYFKGGRIICINKGTEKKIINKFTSNPLSDEND